MDKLLKDILDTVAPSGYEQQLQKTIINYTSSFATTSTDSFLNTYSVINENEEFKILMTAHADEIGLIITEINQNGTCTVRQVGGINPSQYVGERVLILHDKKLIPGIMAVKDETREGKIEVKQLLLDLGVSSKEEALKLVSVGDELVVDAKAFMLNDTKLVARAMDDKIGCYIITKVLENLSKIDCKNYVCSSTTVCEETGLRGAYAAASKIKPNVAIAVDVTYCTEINNKSGDVGNITLAGGPAFCHSSIVHKKLNKLLQDTAKKYDIPYQMELAVRSTGTDADRMHYTNEGTPVCLVSIPLRYMHSKVEMADINTINQTIEILTKFCMELNKDLDLTSLD